MVTVEEFSRLVSGVYAAAVTPQHWAVALADISRILNASGAGLLTGAGSSRSVMTATVPLEASGAYIAYYRTIDYVLDAVEKSPVGLIRGGRDWLRSTPIQSSRPTSSPVRNGRRNVHAADCGKATHKLSGRGAERARTVRYRRACEVHVRADSPPAAGAAHAGKLVALADSAVERQARWRLSGTG